MVNMMLVSAALVLLVEAWKWGKFFRLDELPEFNRSVLEVMRQPLEDRIISISRAKYSTEYPASFMLVASMNPCPCGYYGHPKKKCVCNEYQRTHYMSKISGPLLDRIDLQIEVQPVDFDQLLCKPSAIPNSFDDCRGAANRSRRQMSSKAPGEPSAAIRQRVIAARMLQERRFKDEPGIHCNAQMTPSLLHKYAEPNAAGLASKSPAPSPTSKAPPTSSTTTSWKPSPTATSTAPSTSALTCRFLPPSRADAIFALRDN